MNREKILKHSTILFDSGCTPQNFPFAEVPAERILEEDSRNLQAFVKVVFQILSESHCLVVTENRPVADFLLAINHTQSADDYKVGVYCGGKLEADEIEESIQRAENTFVTADGTVYVPSHALCEHIFATEEGRILCIQAACSAAGEPLFRKLEPDGAPCGVLLPETFHAQNYLGTLASVQHHLKTAQQVRLAQHLLEWDEHPFFDIDQTLLFHKDGKLLLAAVRGDIAVSSDFVIVWAVFTGTSLDSVQDPVDAIVGDIGRVPASLLEDASIAFHTTLYPNTSTGLENVDMAALTRRTLDRLACIYQ